MNTILIVALIAAGLGFILILFKLFKKAGKFASKLPTNFFIVFTVYLVVGLSGFLLKDRIADRPIWMGVLVIIISLSVGIIFAHGLTTKWSWAESYSNLRKALYLIGILLTGMVGFCLSFFLSEHWGLRGVRWSSDLGLWLGLLIAIVMLPFLVVWVHQYWNEIPQRKQLQQIFQLPIDGSPPFIETGGASLHFQFMIPLDYRSDEIWKSKVAVPYNKTLAEVFHYKLHEHNVVKRFVKKIVYAEQNQRAKVYGWTFYRFKKKYWGYLRTREYLNPQQKVGQLLTQNEAVFAERVKTWEQ